MAIMCRAMSPRSLTTALLSTLLTTALSAQVVREQFQTYDRDKNGKVSRKEFPGSNAQFEAADRNKDGGITLAEYRRSAAARNLLSAMRVDAASPRDRVDVDQLRLARLEQIGRFDRNGDGRIEASEWTGALGSFTALDLNGDQVVDSADRKLAARQVEDNKRGTYDQYETFDLVLPAIDEIFKRRDKDGDQLLSKQEVKPTRFGFLFDLADVNFDKFLDREEVMAMVRNIAERTERRPSRYIKPRAYIVPFSSWDKNDDNVLDVGEWLSARYLFPRIDLDRDGRVTKREIERYKLSVEGENFVERFDLNRDGGVSLSEFAGSADAFRRADRNRDGRITKSDR